MILGAVGKILKELETTWVMRSGECGGNEKMGQKKNYIVLFRNTLILIISLLKKEFVCLFVYLDFQTKSLQGVFTLGQFHALQKKREVSQWMFLKDTQNKSNFAGFTYLSGLPFIPKVLYYPPNATLHKLIAQ